MEPSEIIDWALSHGFRQTGSNAYSARHEGQEFQMVLKKDRFLCQRLYPGGHPENISMMDYPSLCIDEFGMLQGAGLAEAFVRSMWNSGRSAPVWFTPEYLDHAVNEMIPRWEEAIASLQPRGPR